MKKELIYQLIMSHYRNNEKLFRETSIEIANYFINKNSRNIGHNIMAFLDGEVLIKFQDFDNLEFEFLNKIKVANESLYMPEKLSHNIEKIIKVIVNNKNNFSKFLFYGKPGTGKTKTIEFIARRLKYPIYSIKAAELVSSLLGTTSKNIKKLISEILELDRLNLPSIVLIDEIDLIAFNRIDIKDHREMGRATTSFFSLLETELNNVFLFATTNLHKDMDEALKRRFDWNVSFDMYSNSDLSAIFYKIFNEYYDYDSKNINLVKNLIQKIAKKVPYDSPANIKRDIKIIKATSNDYKEFLQNIFLNIHKTMPNLKNLEDFELSTRQKSLILNMSKSSINNKIRLNNE